MYISWLFAPYLAVLRGRCTFRVVPKAVFLFIYVTDVRSEATEGVSGESSPVIVKRFKPCGATQNARRTAGDAWSLQGLNLRPTDYESAALTN